MSNNCTDLLDYLICPQSFAIDGTEVPLSMKNGELTSGKYTYPVSKNGIPNMKLPFNQGEFTSYDDLLGGWTPGESNATSILKANSLRPEDVAGKKILLAGTGTGMDIEWILSLEPERLVCLDYSPHIEKIALKYSEVPNVNFLIGDICDLPISASSFDLVLSFGIIQQCRSPEIAFIHKVRALKQNGKLSIANLYSDNLHNHRISLCRHKYRIHEMDRSEAKKFIKKKTVLYYLLIKLGGWRICKRVLLPFMLQYNNIPGKPFGYYITNAEDFYMSSYRHQTSAEQVKYWTERLVANYTRTPKGHQISV
jgi:SAM-dependent methyltransferase